MKNIQQFKTNIHCGNCIAKVKEPLNQAIGEGKWEVDTQSPSKILTADIPATDISKVIIALAQTGFQAELI